MKLAMTLTAALLFAMGSCNDDADNGGGDNGHTPHDFKPQHGGQLVELGDHEPMVEIVHDAAAGVITLYVFDDHLALRSFLHLRQV